MSSLAQNCGFLSLEGNAISAQQSNFWRPRHLPSQQRMQSSPVCASCAMSTADKYSHLAAGMLQPYHFSPLTHWSITLTFTLTLITLVIPLQHTHNRFVALWILSGTTWVSRYQKNHSPTHTYHGHHSSLICFIHLLWYMASSMFSPRTKRISVQVFFGLPLGLATSTSYSILFFTQSLSSFRNTCPYHRNLFHCSTEIMSSNQSLSLNSLLGILSCSFAPHIHLTILISAHWSATSFPFLWARSHFHATYYFAHNRCTISLSLSMIYPYW